MEGAGRYVQLRPATNPKRASCLVSFLSLGEETILRVGNNHRTRTFLIIVRHMVDSTAHRITAHESGIIRLQQFGNRRHVLHSGVKR
jgi:hypothetical protein